MNMREERKKFDEILFLERESCQQTLKMGKLKLKIYYFAIARKPVVPVRWASSALGQERAD